MNKDLVFRVVLVFCIGLIIYQFGIKPVFLKEPYRQSSLSWTNSSPEDDRGRYDVIVYGENPEGISAAVSAARMGARTLLISEGEDLGGIVGKCMYTDLEIQSGINSKFLNMGILKELYDRLGDKISISKYKIAAKSIIRNEKNLEVLYKSEFNSPILVGNIIVGLNISTEGKAREVYGKRVIDATDDGKILVACGVPYFMGSEDLNLHNTYLPVRLNFEVSGVDYNEIKKLMKSSTGEFYNALSKYEPSYVDIRIGDFKVADQSNNIMVLQGIEAFGINVADKKALDAAYRNCVAEAKDLTVFLALKFNVLKRMSFVKPADNLILRESRHFTGEYVLKVNDILEDMDFTDKIAMGSYQVDGSKLVGDRKKYIIGKPQQYGIPLGCIVPLKTDNLLMTGRKASYSSLASSSAGAMGVSITTGQSAGIVAAYTVTARITPRDLAVKKEKERLNQVQKLFEKNGIYLPSFNIPVKNSENWVYPAIRQLNSLGLIAGVIENEYNLDFTAKSEDLAVLLLNGVYRLTPEKYNLEFDVSVRKYYNKENITPEKLGEMLLSLHGDGYDSGKAYNKACSKGYINEVMQLRLKDKKNLTIDDIFYIAASNLRIFTKKNIND